MTIHTLGPDKTNCQAAANHYLNSNEINGNIKLYDTLEEATKELVAGENNYLLSCIAYPDLHRLVFKNLSTMRLVDSFIFNTIPMVLASQNKKQKLKKSIITHPAPIDLIDINEYEIIEFANSNSDAAVKCSKGDFHYCITTLTAAEKFNLKIIKNFGQIPMGFALHKAI